MKAVLSNRIYLEVDFYKLQELDKELTYTIPPRRTLDPPVVIKNMSKIRDNLVSIPYGRQDLIPDNYEIVDKRVLNPVEFPEFKFTLRPSQQEVYDNFNESGIINASVSWGKTFTGVALARKLGQKTLVVTHNTGLRDQWIKEINHTLDMDPGVIGSGRFEVDSPIVIGNTQSLYNNVEKIHKEYGTLIMDEMHHVPSRTFSKIIDSNYAKHKIGLSGTIRRKDGRHVVFKDYFGNDVFKPPKENYMPPSIHIIKSDVRFPDGAKMPWAIKINELTSNEDYKHLICSLASVYASKGHKVLVVSDRVHFIKACVNAIGEEVALAVTGSTENIKRMNLEKELESKHIIFGTQSIFSEGISVNPLSCLILATPVNNEPLLTQLIGRVVRVHEGKLNPIVVDIHLKGHIAKSQASNRMGHYIREGYKIKSFG